ncbi:MAG: polysaccharide deacetylase family protein [Kiritimatiellae bacterium]|nr:polysaccharide deacetylase family protein [Kiritimatiellia bacterium]
MAERGWRSADRGTETVPVFSRVLLLSIDVESWVYSRTAELAALDSGGRRAKDAGYIRDSVAALLDLFDTHEARTTFFFLAETFEWYPDIVRETLARGHEVGFHGFGHVAMDKPEALARELERSARFLAEIRPVGFRAPFMRLSEAAMGLLAQRGFRYDSSTYAPPERTGERSGILEVPVSTRPLLRRKRSAHRLPRDLKYVLATGEFPYGAAMAVSIFGAGICRCIARDIDRVGWAHVFLHNLQIVPSRCPLFRHLGFLIRNPGCVQFAVSSRRAVETLLQRYRVVPIRTFLGV